MQKNFFTICFILSLNTILPAYADVVPITGSPIEIARKQSEDLEPRNIVPDDMPDPNNQEEVRQFFKKRFEDALLLTTEEPIDLSTSSSVDVVRSMESQAREKEKKKTLFQKMYEKAIASLHTDENGNTDNGNEAVSQEEEQETVQTATRFFRIVEKSNTTIAEPQIPTVSIPLPSGRQVLAPAQEHIPYWLSYIDVQANGYIKVEDTIVIVANGRKFAQGVRRVFSKYAKTSQKIELILENVTINGTEIPYTAEEIGTQIVLKPKYNQKLEPGVYTYKFNYIVSNQLLRMKDNNILMRWNITGVPLNVFITSANTIVSVPEGYHFSRLNTFIGEGRKLNNRRSNIYNLAENVTAFSSNTPVLNGESIEIIGALNQNIFLPDFDKSFSYFLINWGSILYAALGFTAILLSFLLSLLTLKKNSTANKFNPSFNGALMRTVLIGKYDRIAFVSHLLDLYRKNCINITEENNRFFIEKSSKPSVKMTKAERRAVSALFARKSNRTEVNNTNNNLFKRARHILEKSINKQVGRYRFIHNVGYLIFSVAMLVSTIIFIAMIGVNTAQSLIILSSTAILYAFYIWIIMHKFKHWYITIPMKVLAMLSVLIIWIFSSIYIGGITSAIIAATILVIFIFIRIFAEQNNFINEAKSTISRYKEYLIGNAESINLSRNFINQQSNIFALSIEEYFPQNVANQNYYKLDMAEGLRRSLIGII